MYQKLLKRASYLGIFIFLLNLVANKFYWYTSIFGFDKFMHTLGGVFVVFLVSTFFLKELKHNNTKEMFITLVLAAFVIGLVWEYYEYIVQHFIKNSNIANFSDSVGDLVFDCLGGAVGTFFVILMKKRYNKLDERI